MGCLGYGVVRECSLAHFSTGQVVEVAERMEYKRLRLLWDSGLLLKNDNLLPLRETSVKSQNSPEAIRVD